MDYRRVELFNGKVFKVPKYIVRLDSSKTHGWQLRFGDSKLYSDHSIDGSGARASLRLATAELARRLRKMPAPSGLRTTASARKVNDLPLGISGPMVRNRPGRGSAHYYLQVSYPVMGARSVNRSIYVATENTLCKDKFDAALAKAIALRDSGVRKFKLANTKSMRARAGKSGLLAK